MSATGWTPVDESTSSWTPVQELTPPSQPPESFLDKVADMTPVIGTLRRGSAAIQRWAEANEPLKNSAAMPASPILAALKQGATGTIADVAGLVHGAASPAGIATTAATIAAPEVMAPALVAHGLYSGVKGWGDISNPDVLQNELSAASEVAGGAAMGAGTIAAKGGPVVQGIRSQIAQRAVNAAPAEALNNFQKAIPSTKSAPYDPADYQAARPYLEQEHQLNSIDATTDARDAANSAIGKIEDHIGAKIQQKPNLLITTDPLSDVRQALASNPRGQAFVDAGLKELGDFNLDQPTTVVEADAIRKQLNAENQGVLQKNNYKINTARATDPGFAAREAAAESLRTGIYDQFPDMQDLRLDEGSLIKIRNAAQNQAFNGTNRVGGTAQPGFIARTLRRGSTIAGASLGYGAGGPVGGAVGAEAGSAAGEALSPQNLTRNQLVAKSFETPVTSGQTLLDRMMAEVPTSPRIAGLLGRGATITPPPADTSGTIPTPRIAYSPTTRAERLGLLLGPKPGEPLVTPAPKEPLQLPSRSGAPLVTPMPGESLIDYLKRRSLRR